MYIFTLSEQELWRYDASELEIWCLLLHVPAKHVHMPFPDSTQTMCSVCSAGCNLLQLSKLLTDRL